MSAATSAEAVGIYRSVSTGEDETAVPKLDAATTATEAGLLETRVTADVEVPSGVSFCCTARITKISINKQMANSCMTPIINMYTAVFPTFNSLSGLIACAL